MIYWNDQKVWSDGTTLVADGQEVVTCGGEISAIEQVGADRLAIWTRSGCHLVVDRQWQTCYHFPVGEAEIRSRVADGLVAIAVANRGETHNLQEGSVVKTWDAPDNLSLLGWDFGVLVVVQYNDGKVIASKEGEVCSQFKSGEPPRGVVADTVECVVWASTRHGYFGPSRVGEAKITGGRVERMEFGIYNGHSVLIRGRSGPNQLLVDSASFGCHDSIAWPEAIIAGGFVAYPFDGGIGYHSWHALWEVPCTKGLALTPHFEVKEITLDARPLALAWDGTQLWARMPDDELKAFILEGRNR